MSSSESIDCSGCQNVSHQQQLFSELPSPRRRQNLDRITDRIMDQITHKKKEPKKKPFKEKRKQKNQIVYKMIINKK